MIWKPMKQLTLLSLLACSVIFAGCSTATPTETTPTDQTPVVTGTTTDTATGTIVGNDRDEHGCITSAGYTRNVEKQECTRSREDTQATGTTISTTTTTTTTASTTTKSITLADVAKHTTESDCRTAINGTVYDVTAFFGKHPGGDKNLFRVCGIDATQVFERKHGGDMKANNVLAGFEIGALAQ
jgi:cytochrome b involved in lipid metabolism